MIETKTAPVERLLPRNARLKAARRLPRQWTPYWFLLPALLVLGIFIVLPILYAFWVSLHRYQWNMPNIPISFRGLDNYLNIPDNSDLMASIGWTVAFAFISVSAEFVLGFALALLLNVKLIGRLRGLLRGIFLVPMMMSGAVAGFMWRMLFDPEYGPINHILTLLGAQPIHWFTDTGATRLAVIIVDVWIAMPFIMLILLAGMQGIAPELYEAARIDGASNRQLLTRITLPLLRYPIMIALIIRSMDALRVFDLIFSLTQGGPGNATTTTMLYTYRYAMQYFQMGRASAISFVFLVVIGAISLVYMRVLRTDDGG